MQSLFLASQQMNSSTDKVDEARLKEILAKPFLAKDKLDLPLITHSSCESKSKEHILAHNKQECLSLDIDDGQYRDIKDIAKDLEDLNVDSYCIYTTSSHSPSEGKFKFRAIIPLNEPMTCEQFTIVQLALCRLFNSDNVVARIQQILYLGMAGPTYEYIDNLKGTGFNIESCPKIMEAVVFVNNDRLAAEVIRENELKEAEEKRKARKEMIDNSPHEQLESVFDLCEKSFSMPDLLAQYGFKRKGGRYLHPNSSSGLAGVMILDGRYFSHHSMDTDELANGKSHSCFDLIKYWEYDNNQEKAILGLSKELTINGQTLFDHNEGIKKSNFECEIKKHNAEMHQNLRAIEDMARERAENKAILQRLYEEDNEPLVSLDSGDSDESEYVVDGRAAEKAQTKAITTLNDQAEEIDVDSDEILNFDVTNSIMPTKKMSFDLLKPTGIVEKIIQDIAIKMRRPDPALAVGPALFIAMRAALPSVEQSRLNPNYDVKKYGIGLNGFKIYLNLLSIGISASGKEFPQQVLSSTLNYLGDDVYGRIASDKDLAVSMIDSIGSCCCVIDEAGSLFNTMKDGNSASYMKGLAGTMTAYATSTHISFDGLVKRGLKRDYITALNSLTRSLENVDEEDETKEKFIKANIEKEIQEVKWKIDACQNGIDLPQFGMLASSTPTDMKGTITLDSLNTGQMSRYLMFVGKGDVDPLRERVEGIDYNNLNSDLLTKLFWIRSNAHVAEDYVLRKDAVNTYSYILKWAESRRNHGKFSVLYRRSFETVVRLASILALEDRIVTKQHLEWAFCLVRSNIESFIITCASDNTETPKEVKFMLAILDSVKSNAKGSYVSVIKQRLSKKAEWSDMIPDFERCVERLIKDGYAVQEGKLLMFTGKLSVDGVE